MVFADEFLAAQDDRTYAPVFVIEMGQVGVFF